MYRDPLLLLLSRLRVMPLPVDENDSKLASLDALRKSNVYKQLKLKHIDILDVERTLVQDYLTPRSFLVLCALYEIDIVVICSRYYWSCGSPKYAIRRDKIIRLPDLSDLYELNPIKPLYSISHYTLPDLQIIATQLNIPHEKQKKTEIYITVCHAVKLLIA